MNKIQPFIYTQYTIVQYTQHYLQIKQNLASPFLKMYFNWNCKPKPTHHFPILRQVLCIFFELRTNLVNNNTTGNMR